jgi:hypothetical protein
MSVDDFRIVERDPESKKKIYFFGLVNYTDVWGKEWTTGFAWILGAHSDADKRAWRIATKDEIPAGYNYRREEAPKDEKSDRSWLRKFIPARFYRPAPK